MLTPTLHTIDFGEGTKAKLRYDNLQRMLRDIIYNYQQGLMYTPANTLRLFMRTLAWTALPEYKWQLELKPDEWQALSRGLQSLGSPAGRSMYQWLSSNRLTDYDDGD